MKVKIIASSIWTPEDCSNDKEVVRHLIEDKPVGVILDYLEDAYRGTEDMSKVEVSVEVIED